MPLNATKIAAVDQSDSVVVVASCPEESNEVSIGVLGFDFPTLAPSKAQTQLSPEQATALAASLDAHVALVEAAPEAVEEDEEPQTPIEKWVAALRSGKYEQVAGVLARPACGSSPERFCCLGIACDLYAAENDDLIKEVDRDAGTIKYRQTDGKYTGTSVLPPIVREWLGGVTDTGYYQDSAEDYGPTRCLAADNDSGSSFEDIADIIERNIDTLTKGYGQ